MNRMMFTQSSGTLDSTTTSLFTNEYGQSRTKDSATFSILGQIQTPPIKVKCITHSDWTDTLKFTTHPTSGPEVLVYKYTYSDTYSGTLSPPLQLSPGDYEVTLSTPSADQGCEVTFTYNYDSVYNYQNVSVGGLRIKTITEKSGTGSPDIITNYSYLSGSNSTGILYDVPTFAQLVRSDFIAKYGYYTSVYGYHQDWITVNGCTTFPDPGYYVSSGNLRPMSTVQGSHIGYQQVKVSQTGNGYSIYHYYINNDGNYILKPTGAIANTNADITYCNANIPSFPAAPLPFDSRRGQLSWEEHYDNSGFMLQHVDYLPFYDNTATPPTPIFIASALWNGQTILGTFDSIKTVHEDSVVTIHTDYPKTGGSITTQKTKYFGSPYHNQVTKEVGFNSEGDSLINIYQYAFDFRITGCDNSTCLTNFLTAKSGCEVTYNNAWNTCNNGDDACITAADTNFFRCENNARITYVGCQLSASSNYQSCHSTAKRNADGNLNPILEMQDDYMNDPIEISSWKNSELLGAQFNQYKVVSGIAYINAEQKINLSAPSNSFTNADVNGHGLIKDNRYDNEAIVNFSLGNLSDVTGRDGVVNCYIWGYQNTLPIAKVLNALSSKIAYTSFEEDGGGNWNIGSTIRLSGGNVTGTKYYQLSNGAITKNLLTPGKQYVVSYWTQSPSSLTINGTTGVKGKTYGTWSYYEHLITLAQGVYSVTIPQVNATIDELRLYPVAAQMTSYTYDPLRGITSESDLNDRTTYYEYDSLGRLKDIKDQDGNILKTFNYHYQTPAP